MKDLVGIHRKCCREINGWPVQIKCSDTQFQSGRLAKLVDGRAAGLKVPHHLLGDFLRERADALLHHAVIAGEDKTFAVLDLRPVGLLPFRHPDGKLFQLPEGSRRLCQLVLPRRRRGPNGIIGLR